MEHITEVKYLILQHLPVFLQDTMDGESDSQMTTSIYVDNYALELYKGRLGDCLTFSLVWSRIRLK